MNLWFVFALMTVAAVFAVLWPLGRRTAPQTGGNEAASTAINSRRSIATSPAD